MVTDRHSQEGETETSDARSLPGPTYQINPAITVKPIKVKSKVLRRLFIISSISFSHPVDQGIGKSTNWLLQPTVESYYINVVSGAVEVIAENSTPTPYIIPTY